MSQVRKERSKTYPRAYARGMLYILLDVKRLKDTRDVIDVIGLCACIRIMQ